MSTKSLSAPSRQHVNQSLAHDRYTHLLDNGSLTILRVANVATERQETPHVD